MANEKGKSLESWIRNAARSIRGAKDAPMLERYSYPLKTIKQSSIGANNEISDFVVENTFGKNALQPGETDPVLAGLFLRPRSQGPGSI